MKNIKTLIFYLTLLLSVLFLPEKVVANSTYQYPYNVSLYLRYRYKTVGVNGFDLPQGIGFHNKLITISFGKSKILKKPLNLGLDPIEYGGSFTFDYNKNRKAVFAINSFWGQEIISSTDTITTSNSFSLNGYLRLNQVTKSKFVPFIGVIGGINVMVTNTETESTSRILFSETNHTLDKSSSLDISTSFIVSLQVGANYFFSDSFSINFHYNIYSPKPKEEKTIEMIIFGMSYWFTG